MKRILITGKNSYIGNAFEDWIGQWPNKYQITKISVRDDRWRNEDWSKYDTVLHVAGIAHNSSDKKLKGMYYKVNTELAIDVARKAKLEGIRQFIHLSSIIVFGSGVEKITPHTICNPDNFYGDSKLKAEKGIFKFNDKQFNVAIIRPPMVYGHGSKGNFSKLVKLAKYIPIFPDMNNKRSMVFIEVLMKEIEMIVDNNLTGYFHPQNPELVKISEMVSIIAKNTEKKIIFTKFFNPIIKLLISNNIINKLFGNLYYYNMTAASRTNISLEETIKRSI